MLWLMLLSTGPNTMVPCLYASLGEETKTSLTSPELRVGARSFEDLSVSDLKRCVGYAYANARDWSDGRVTGDQIQPIFLILQGMLKIQTVRSTRLGW